MGKDGQDSCHQQHDKDKGKGFEKESIPASQQNQLLRILTVGDGDLTLSLALMRAYGPNQVHITASTLVQTSKQLVETYPHASQILKELQSKNVTILYGLDATQLHHHFRNNNSNDAFDWILFQHPHLGLDSLRNHKDEEWHAHRHFALLAHYFWSAAQYAKATPTRRHDIKIHVCLCGQQHKTWRLAEAAKRAGLAMVGQYPTSIPPSQWLSPTQAQGQQNDLQLLRELHPLHSKGNQPCDNNAMTPNVMAAPRKYRNGKLGSKHFLGKYGYQHQRTHGILSSTCTHIHVEASQHFVLSLLDDNDDNTSRDSCRQQQQNEEMVVPSSYSCYICGSTFEQQNDLDEHLKAPALPDPPRPTSNNNITGKQPQQISKRKPNAVLAQKIQVDTKLKRHKVANTDNESPKRNNKTTGQKHVGCLEEKVHSNDINNDNVDNTTILLLVSIEHNGKRLRWYLSHSTEFSKRQCEQHIQRGFVKVNEKVVLDSSRILSLGDSVSVTPPKTSGGNDKTILEIIYEHENVVVAMKPVGMRTQGSFSSQTLESVLTQQKLHNNKSMKDTDLSFYYRSLSKMDTGCSGLCVLERTSQETSPQESVTTTTAREPITFSQVYTALVHGHVPQEWTNTVEKCLLLDAARRWKQRPNTLDDHNNTKNNNNNESCSTNKSLSVKLCCTQQAIHPPLATLEFHFLDRQRDCSAGIANAICFWLRKQGHPVVNDRFCQSEYMELPRSIRNTIKGKLCIGCFQIVLYPRDKEAIVQVPIPQRLNALHWQKHVESSNTVDKKKVT